MADAKVSALTAVVTPAGTDEIPVNQAGTSKKLTLAQVETYVLTSPVFPAGSASAGSWPLLTAGTLLTTAEAGAIELDANCLYATTDAGNRGYVPIKHYIRADSARAFTSNTSSQALFTSPANGRITLETGLYRVQAVLHFTGMSATSGNLLINLLGAGTATVGTWMWMILGVDAAQATGTVAGGSSIVTSTSPAQPVPAQTGSTLTIEIQGSFEVTAAGTLIPAMTLTTASAASLAAGSFLMLERMGSVTAVSLGQWD